MSPLTLIVAIFGALITYFQWRTAHQQCAGPVDKRLAAFKEIEKAAKDVVNARLPADMELPFWSFVNAQGNARFLFGPEISAALQEMLKDITAVMAASGISKTLLNGANTTTASMQRCNGSLTSSSIFRRCLCRTFGRPEDAQRMASLRYLGPDAGREA